MSVVRAGSPPRGCGPFSIDPATGGFRDAAGNECVPTGVNYWPASCGVELWVAWPEAEIRRDLDLVRELGLNCVRFFLRWQDFEPEEGTYNERAFERLETLLEWHRERGLLAHPSLFVGWMSGGIFWPNWHRRRNVFSDPELRARAIAFARKAAEVCAKYPDTVLAIDQGNELCCLPESAAAAPADIASWCGEISRAIHDTFPGVLVVSGNEQNQVSADTGWRFGAQNGCDFYSMHSYPVSAWHALAFDGMTDPLAQSLLPFYVKCARAWGPVMVQEFGTLFTRGTRECDTYLRAVLPACRRAGANGFLWWCLRDITATVHPYAKNAFEGQLGLVDDANRVKPGLQYFITFARECGAPAPRRLADVSVALYWPDEYYPRGNPANPGNDPRQLSRQMAVAHFALGQLGQDPAVVRAQDVAQLPASVVLVIPGAKLTEGELAVLEAWVRTGGHAIWHAPDAMTWGRRMEIVLGAEPIDFRAPRAVKVGAFGKTWNLTRFPRDIFVHAQTRGGKVRATDQEGRPVVFTHALGAGCIAACLAAVDAQFADRSDDRSTRDDWTCWYRGMLELLGAAVPAALSTVG